MTPPEDPNGRDRYCGARKRQGDHEPCRRPAGWGTDHLGFGCCKLHGGSTRDHGKAANKAKAANAVAVFGLPRDVEPTEALMDELHRTAGHVFYLAAKIAEFDDDDELKQLDMTGRFEKPAVWVEMYANERKHLTAVAKACLDAGIAERQVRIAEGLADRLIAVIEAVLVAVGLDSETLARARAEVPAALRAVGSGAA